MSSKDNNTSPTSSNESSNDDNNQQQQQNNNGKSSSNSNIKNNDPTQPAGQNKDGKFYPCSGPATDPFAVGLINQLPPNAPHVGIQRARLLRKQWLTQTRQLPQPRPEPDFDELEEAFDDEVPFDPPVHLPNLLLMLLDIWEDEGLLN